MEKTEQNTFERLFKTSYKKTTEYIKFLCRNHSDAEDLTQETYVRAFRSYHTFDHRSSFDSWVMTIARNQYLDSLRRKNCRVQTVSVEANNLEGSFNQIPDQSLTPEALALQAEPDPDIATMINKLDESHRLLLQWIAIEEQTYSEVAMKLQIPVRTVMSKYSRALKEARNKYRDAHQHRQLASTRGSLALSSYVAIGT